MILLSALLALVLTAVVLGLWANRPRRISVDVPVSPGFPEHGFSHDSFAELMNEHVDADGRVEYEQWRSSAESMAQLDSYLAAISRYSPDSSSERFATRNDELAYWMYAYNAWVIKGVLLNWPLDSVTNVKAPLEVVKGMGFFYQLRFQFGGKFMSLLTVENSIIRKRYQDPRIHFVLNCASESCPVARPELPVGGALEELLATAALEFINDSQNASVDHDRQVVVLSSIFKWYKKDFDNYLLANGLPGRGLLAYLQTIAEGPLRPELERAADYDVEFRDYDWRLNEAD
jgi:hypothetical protein